MARLREFDVEEAVEKAMHVFWRDGYAGASLPALLDGMGITRGSLYKAFGSKKALFQLALQRYDDLYVGPAVTRLEASKGDGEARIAAVFRSGLKAVRDGDRRGCLLCNTAAGTVPDDADIARLAAEQIDKLAQGFLAALRETVAGSTMTPATLKARARALALSYVGLRVMARAGEEEPVLKSAVKATIGGLG